MKKTVLKKLSEYQTSNNTSKLVKIGEASQLIGVSIDTLRRWEKRGWLNVTKTPGGTRLYDKEQIQKLNPHLKRGPKPLFTSFVKSAPAQTFGSEAQARREETNSETAASGTEYSQAAETDEVYKLSESAISLPSDNSILSTLPKLNVQNNTDDFDFTENETKTFFHSLKESFISARSSLFTMVLMLILLTLITLPAFILSKYFNTDQKISETINNPVLRGAWETKNLAEKIMHIVSPKAVDKLAAYFPTGSPPLNVNLNPGNESNPAQQRDLGYLNGAENPASGEALPPDGQVLAEAFPGSFLQINLDTEINGTASVSGTLTAPNILYTITPGTNITVTGDPQNPTISATGLTEADTLATVTARGATTSTPVSLTGGLTLGGMLNLGVLTSDPSSGTNGQTYYNSTSNQFRCYVNGSWTNCDTQGGGSGVTSITGTSNQVIASSSTGSVTLSLPQSIGTGSTPAFAAITLSDLSTAGGIVYTNSSGGLNTSVAGTSGQCLQSGGTGAPTWGSCGGGGTVSGSGTANTISKFTAASTIGDSLLTDDGTTFAINTNKFTVTQASGNTNIAGTLDVTGAITGPTATNTINGLIINSGALTGVTGFTQSSGAFAFSGGGNFSVDSAGVDISTGGALSGITGYTQSSGSFSAALTTTNSAGFSSTTANTDSIAIKPQTTTATNSFTGTITSADLTDNRTWTFPNASGTVAVSASSPISLSAAGDISCSTCLTSSSGVTTATGTANQILVNGDTSAHSGAITLTLPSAITAPGSLTTTTSLSATTTVTAGTGLTVTTGNAAITAGALTLNGTTRIANDGTGTFIAGTAIGTQTFGTNTITDSGALTISSTTSSAITLDSGTTGTVNLGTGNNAKTINLGTGNAGNTINIGTNDTVADAINIASALDTTTIGGTITLSNLASGTVNNAVCQNGTGSLITCTASSSAVSGTSGQIAFFNGTNSVTSESSGFGWDTSNKLLTVTSTATTQTASTFTVNSLTTGTGVGITSSSTAGGASGSSYLLQLTRSGANSNTAHSAYGIYSTVTNTNATSGTNIAGYFSASGATTANYGLLVAAGNVGIGDITPSAPLEVGNGTDSLQVSSVGDITFVDADGGASITGPAGGDLSIIGSPTSGTGLAFESGAGSIIAVNDLGADVDFRAKTDSNANALVLDAGLFSGVGQFSIGAAAQGTATAFTIIDNPAITATSNQNFFKAFVDNNAAVTISGATTSSIVASLGLNEPNITATGTVTNAATLYLSGAPTEGSSGNFSIWVDNGEARFENTPVSGSTTGSALTVVPQYVVEAADLTLSGIKVSLDTNSNTDPGDIAYGVNIDDITTTAGPTEYGLRIGSGYDYQAYFELGSRDLRLSVTAPSAGTSPLTLTVPAIAADDTFCIRTLGNCFGAGSSGVTYTGQTTNAITKFTSNAGEITSAGLTDDGSTFAFSANRAISMAAGTGNLTQAYQPAGTTGTANAHSITSTFGIDATDQTLSGIFVDADTNSNTDSGDTLYGVNIDTITASSATEYGLAIGSGFDQNLYFNDTSTSILLSDGGTITITDGTNTLCQIVDSGTTGSLSCTGNITGGSGGTIGYWSRTGTTLETATANDNVLLDTTNTSGADLAITNTGAYTGTGIFNLTANSATTGTVQAISATGMTTGEILDITGTWAPTDGSTNEAIDINITHTPTTSADNFQSINLTTADGTALANTIYGISNTLTLTGNADKLGVGAYSTVTSSSTTADTLVALDLATTVSGIIASGTGVRDVYGLRSQPSAGAESTADTTNVFGIYSKATADVGAGGTVNAYGLYVANGTYDTDGTSTAYGLYIEDISGADTNVAINVLGSSPKFRIADAAALTFTEAGGNNTLCTITDSSNVGNLNCTGTITQNGTAVATGTGTTNTLTKWSNTSGGLADSGVSDDGSTITLAANRGLTMATGTGVYLQTYNSTSTPFNLRANSVATAAVAEIQARGLTSGWGIYIDGPNSSGGITGAGAALFATSRIESGNLAYFNSQFVGSAQTAYGVYINGADSTSAANVSYNSYNALALTGNAAKTGYGNYTTVTSSSTTADTLVGYDLSTTVTGIITTGTRSVYGYRSQPGAGAESTGGTTNVYGVYSTASADVGAGGTVNAYGLYVGNGTYDTDGTSTAYGLYIEDISGADTNIDLNFTASPIVRIGDAGVLTFTEAGGNNTLCTITDSSNVGNLACTGNITGASSGTVGYWTRSGTTLSPATSNDVLSVTGNSGNIVTITSTSTGSNDKSLAVTHSGAGTTDYAGHFTNTGAATTNVGIYATASGGSNNYAAVFEAGFVGIGDTTPSAPLEVGDGTDSIQFSSVGDITFVDANGGASITGPAGGALAIDAAATGLNLQADGSIDVNLAGGSAATGCTVANSTGNITCSGDATFTGGDITGANSESIDIGEAANGTISLNIDGTSGLSVGSTGISSIGNVAHTIVNSSGALNIDSNSTGAINIGTAANAKTITIGNATGATALAFNSGTGSQTFTSQVVSGTTTTSAFVFDATALTTGTGAYFTSDAITQGKLLQIATTGNTLTTGTLADFRTTATSLTGAAGTGSLLNLDWTPGSATTATGDLFALNIGSNGTTTGKLFNILDSSSSIFSVSETQFTTSLPSSFTSSGDVSIAYDLVFTNPTASYVTSAAPLSIIAGESFNSSNLTLKTYNQGSIVFDVANTTTTALDLTNTTLTTGTALNISLSALTTGKGINITSSNSSQTTASALSITQSGTTTGFTGNFVSLTGSSTTGAGNLLQLTTVNTTDGAALNIVSNALTTGEAVEISSTGTIANGGNLVILTADSATTGDILSISATGLTTGQALQIIGPSSAGVTGDMISVNGDVGSGGVQLKLNPDFSGSAVTGYGLNIAGTDSTANANTDYNFYSTLTLSGNADKLGIGGYSTVTSSSTTADTLVALDLATTVTGIIASGTGVRDVYGLRSQPSAGAESTADTTNVFGIYSKATADVGAGGTVNAYGLYVANGTYDTDGTSTAYGLYIEAISGADNNYGAYIGSNVGIGDTSPDAKLDVEGDSTVELRITSTTGNTGGQLSFYENTARAWTLDSAGAGGVLDFIGYASGSGATRITITDSTTNTLDVTGSIQADFADSVSTTTLCSSSNATSNTNIVQCNGVDYGEFTPSTGPSEKGDLLTLSDVHQPTPDKPFAVEKSSSSSRKIYGIYSTAGTYIGKQVDSSYIPVALTGRVPLKVSLENGPIRKGDFLTLSSTPGVAMKATQPGEVVGKAMEDYDGSVQISDGVKQQEKALMDFKGEIVPAPPAGTGKILVFVNVTYADPNDALAQLLLDDQGQMIISDQLDRLTVQNNLQVGGTVAAGGFMIDSAKINRVGALASIPVSEGRVSIADAINAINTQTTQNTQAILGVADQQASQSVQIAENKQIAEQAITQSQSLNEKVASTSANLASLSQQIQDLLSGITQNDSASQSSDISDNSETTGLSGFSEDDLTPPSELIASDSASLANLDVTDTLSAVNLTALDATVSATFKSLGETFLGQTTVAGDLSVDGTLSFTGSSINSIYCPEFGGESTGNSSPTNCGVLMIQNSPLASGVDFFNGLVTISKDGVLAAKEVIADQFKVTANSSAGTAVLPAGETEIWVPNTLVKPDSIVIITPESQTALPLIVKYKVEDFGFTAGIASAQQNDIKFSYLIVGQEQAGN